MAGVTGQPVLRVTARQQQRYRAGFRFGPEPRVLTEADLPEGKEAQTEMLFALFDDPVLVVEQQTGPDEAWLALPAGEMEKLREAFAEWKANGGDNLSSLDELSLPSMPDDAAPASKDTLGTAGASASSGADVSNPVYTGGGDDNQPSSAAPSAPVAADQDVAANVPEPVAPPHDVPEPTTTQFPKATPSGRKVKAKPAKAD